MIIWLRDSCAICSSSRLFDCVIHAQFPVLHDYLTAWFMRNFQFMIIWLRDSCAIPVLHDYLTAWFMRNFQFFMIIWLRDTCAISSSWLFDCVIHAQFPVHDYLTAWFMLNFQFMIIWLRDSCSIPVLHGYLISNIIGVIVEITFT